MKQHALRVIVDAEELAAIKRAARASGMSASNYARQRIGLPLNSAPGGPQPGSGRPRKQKPDPQLIESGPTE